MKFGAIPKSIWPYVPANGSPVPFTRASSGFEQFCALMRTPESLSILDMSGASQANIGFITDLGHRISSDDLLGAMEQSFGDGDFLESQQSASNAQRFLDHALTFPENFFDGILAWDTLQYLTPPLLDEAIARLLRIVRPDGLILAFFNANEKTTRVPVYNARILNDKTLTFTPRGTYQGVGHYSNRALERLFVNARSLKFFLTRDHLREVIVRR